MLTRPLDKADLRSLLLAIAQAPLGTPLVSLTEQTGLTKAAFRNAIEWAQATYLLDERGLTPEGKLVVTKDPYLETTVTDWLMHFHLSLGDRSLWRYFVYEFLPEHLTFTQDELLSCCVEAFAIESPEQLKKSVRLLLKTYTEPQAIAKSKFLTHEKKLYLTGHSNLSNVYIIGYFLAKRWQYKFESQLTLLIDQITSTEMGLVSILGINQEHLGQQLDVLANHKIIEQRSTKLHLSNSKSQPKEEGELSYQIYRYWETAAELLEQAYEKDIETPNRPLMQSLANVLDDNDGIPDLSQFLEWASGLVALEGGSNTMIKLAS